MNLSRFLSSLLVPFLSAGYAAAQAPLKFESVTIRPSISPTYEERMARTVFTGLKFEGRQVVIGQMPLETLVAYAYDVKLNRVVAPKGADRLKFEISATMPDGATKEQFPEMLREMMVTRFDLKARRESRDSPGYVITIAEGGHKLTPAPASAPEVWRSVEGRPETEFTATWDRILNGFLPNGSQPGTVIRPVLDRTGLEGKFSGVFRLGQASQRAVDREDPMRAAYVNGWASLGFTVEQRDLPQDVIIVEHLATYPSDK